MLLAGFGKDICFMPFPKKISFSSSSSRTQLRFSTFSIKDFFVDVGGIKALISKKTAAVHYDSYIEQHMFLTKKRVEEEALTTYFIGPFLFKREWLQRAFSL